MVSAMFFTAASTYVSAANTSATLDRWACTSSASCNSGNCNNGICCPKGQCGYNYYGTGYCYSQGQERIGGGYVCDAGTWKRQYRWSCTSNDQCYSNNCNNGICCNWGQCGLNNAGTGYCYNTNDVYRSQSCRLDTGIGMLS